MSFENLGSQNASLSIWPSIKNSYCSSIVFKYYLHISNSEANWSFSYNNRDILQIICYTKSLPIRSVIRTIKKNYFTGFEFWVPINFLLTRVVEFLKTVYSSIPKNFELTIQLYTSTTGNNTLLTLITGGTHWIP